MITFVYVSCVISALIGSLLVPFKPKLGTALTTLALIVTIATSVIESQKMKIKDLEAKPTALDVYRGKTTLEITYRDSVAIDSTVVYKVK